MRKLLLLLLLTISIHVDISGQTPVDESKIVVLSDPHVMAPQLLVNDGTAWTTYLAGERKLVDYSKALFDEMITRIKNDIRPGLVLITGDLSKDGETVSHEYVVSKLDELRATGINTLVIPGNHDRGANSNAVYYDGDTTTPAEVASNASFATLYANYGYGASSSRDENSLSYACEPIAGLVIIGIDSGMGSVPAATLTWVCNKAQEAYNKGKQVIAMMHHPLIPHFSGADSFAETVSVADYANVRNALADAGIRIILTGHFHTSDIAKDYNADLSKSIYDVNTGSLDSYPCDYRTITLSNDLKTLNITTSSIELSEVAGFTSMARTRLQTAAENAIAAKGYPWSLIANQIANAFIYHADGDEHDNAAAQTLLASLTPYLTGDYLAMANSMLQDYSNYGDTDRQDRTADRTLEVTMPTLTESVTLAADGWSTYCSNRTLDLSKTDGITGYIVTSTSANKAVITPVTVVPAGTGFILNGTGASPYELYATDAAANDVSGNELIGTLSATAAPANTFVLSTKSDKTGFYPVQSGLTIPAHKAYLVLTGSGARELVINGESTGMNSIKANPADAVIYTVQGTVASEHSKGVVVKNSKLHISK